MAPTRILKKIGKRNKLMSTAASNNDKSDKEDQVSRNKAVDSKESGDVLSKEKVMGEYELNNRKREVTK